MRISGNEVDISKVFNASYHKTTLEHNQNLKNEQINKIQEDISNNNYSLKTTDKDTINVVFAISNDTFGINLSANTIDKLKAHFDKSDFIANNDKVILDGDAADFVSSWFKEIAFNLNLAKADSNNDGRINDNELKNAKLQVNIYGEFNGYTYVVNKLSDEKFINTKSFNSIELERGISISEYLDGVLASDRDFNGELSFAEISFENEKDEKEYLKELKEKNNDIKRYEREFKEAFNHHVKEGQTAEEIKNKQKEKELEQAELLAKLMQITLKIQKMGISSLTSDDNKVLEKLGKSAVAIENDLLIDLSTSVVNDMVQNKNIDIKL